MEATTEDLRLVRIGEHTEDPTTTEQLEQMDVHAQELTSLGGMLIDNLVTLPIDEDPQTNKVVQDMLREVNRLNSVIANYISTLTSEYTQTTRRLKLATDETKRCHWVYKDTVAAFDEWKYRQVDYVAMTSNRMSMAQQAQIVPVDGAKPECSKLASLSRPLSAACEVPVLEEPAPVPLERVSTKARGKMPDTIQSPPPPPIPPRRT
ncbi:hypothetical protein GGF42_001253 [Coemansia sp. RSA 2424]|nr:hypothetical protein GGF42_001253 [Coemansia sp. RSA 2424]